MLKRAVLVWVHGRAGPGLLLSREADYTVAVDRPIRTTAMRVSCSKKSAEASFGSDIFTQMS